MIEFLHITSCISDRIFVRFTVISVHNFVKITHNCGLLDVDLYAKYKESLIIHSFIGKIRYA